MSRKRDDDTEDAINARFNEYDTVIRPILNDFVEAGVSVKEVSADGTIEEVHAEILKQID
jgi:adenylate kinase family enzyme